MNALYGLPQTQPTRPAKEQMMKKMWGTDVPTMGPSHIIGIGALQFVTLVVILFVLRPSIVMHRTHPLKVAAIDPVRLVLIPLVFAIFTFCWPLLRP